MKDPDGFLDVPTQSVSILQLMRTSSFLALGLLWGVGLSSTVNAEGEVTRVFIFAGQSNMVAREADGAWRVVMDLGNPIDTPREEG